jgi:hypothetical protein
VDSVVYINSYPYSEIIGYNELLGKGFYGYFVGEPARNAMKQLELGIIEPGEPQKVVCCKTGFVILPSGEVNWLTPALLQKLISDNEMLAEKLKKDDLKQENTFEMFEYLRQYNENKKSLNGR